MKKSLKILISEVALALLFLGSFLAVWRILNDYRNELREYRTYIENLNAALVECQFDNSGK